MVAWLVFLKEFLLTGMTKTVKGSLSVTAIKGNFH